MNTPEPPGPLTGLEQAAHLHSLAERIHHAADDLPAPEPTHSLASISEEVEDQVRVIAGIFTSLACEATFHSRVVDRHPSAPDSLALRRVALSARAAVPLGWALANLGEAVAQVGHLQEISSGPRTPEQATMIGTALAALDNRLASAHTHLNSAASNLHQDADRLIASAPGTQRAPTPPAAERNRPPAAPPGPPTASRTRR